MINALLVSLANKTVGISVPGMDGLQPIVPDRQYSTIRRILTEGKDSYCVYLAAAVRQDPYIALYCPSDYGTVDLAGTTPGGGAAAHSRTAGVCLVGNASGPAFVGKSTEPLGAILTVTYESPSTVTLKTTTRTVIAPVSATGTRLVVRWPAWTGISGDVELGESYGALTQFEISLRGTYQYAKVREDLEAEPTLFSLLEFAGLEAAYYSAFTDEQRVGIVVLSLYRHFLSLQ